MGILIGHCAPQCPDCGGEHHIFGESHIDEIAERHGVDTVCKIPIDPKLAAAVDGGRIEKMECDALLPIVNKLKA